MLQGLILNCLIEKEIINICEKTLSFRILARYMENDDILDVLDESSAALKIGFCAPAAMGRFAGKPWKRARTDIFERMAGLVLSARKIDLNA